MAVDRQNAVRLDNAGLVRSPAGNHFAHDRGKAEFAEKGKHQSKDDNCKQVVKPGATEDDRQLFPRILERKGFLFIFFAQLFHLFAAA